MARLIVEAVSSESRSTDAVRSLRLLVSVSRADTGAPVTGLQQSDFRICHYVGGMFEFAFDAVSPSELEWEPGDSAPSGCYALGIILRQEGESEWQKWGNREFYSFGLGVRQVEREPEQPEQPEREHRWGEVGQAGLAGQLGPAGPPPQMARINQGQTVIRIESFGE